jgi:hypothetical protein
MPFSIRCAILILIVTFSAGADTIVLKNGRRIVAENVTETGDRVAYQTPAGELSLPKSIVARIERDDFTYSAAARAGTEPPVSAPQIEPVRGYEDVARLTWNRTRGRGPQFPSRRSPLRITPPRNS